MVIAGLQEVSNRERFLQERFNRATRGSGSAVGIFRASTPDSLSEDVVSIHDRNIQGRDAGIEPRTGHHYPGTQTDLNIVRTGGASSPDRADCSL